MQLRAAIHGWPPAAPVPVPPLYVDLPHARVGLVVDRDALMPETTLNLAKWGADLVLIPHDFGTQRYAVDSVGMMPWPYFLWQTLSNDGVHVLATNDFGMGQIVVNGGGYIDSVVTLGPAPSVAVVTLQSGPVRTKYLNAYYDFDLAALLGSAAPLTLNRSSRRPAAQGNRIGVRRATAGAQTETRTPRRLTAEEKRAVLPPGTRPP
jgi:hypothetical protein